jgi:putative transposase
MDSQGAPGVIHRARPLEPVYPLVFFDALRVKIRDEGLVRDKAAHIALGVRADGGKEILGLRLGQNEGAKFWLRVMTEPKNRGVEDVLLAVVDGLKGFPEAILAVFPEATVQTCIVHLLRHSLDFVSWKDRKPVATALKDIHRAVDPVAAEAALTALEAGPWGGKYPAIGQSWRRAWDEVIPFYAALVRKSADGCGTARSLAFRRCAETRSPRRPEAAEAEPWADQTPYAPVVLLHDVVEELALP